MAFLKCCSRAASCHDQATCFSPQVDREKEREEKLNTVLEDSKQLLNWLNDSKVLIKTSGSYGGRYEVVMQQIEEHKDLLREMDSREIMFVRVLETFDVLIQSPEKSSTSILEEKLNEVKNTWTQFRSLCTSTVDELTSILSNVAKLENLIKEMDTWIIGVEDTSSLFSHVSTVLDVIKEQISEVKSIYSQLDEKEALLQSIHETAQTFISKCRSEDVEALNLQFESLNDRRENVYKILRDRNDVIDEVFEPCQVFFEGFEQLMFFLDNMETIIRADMTINDDIPSVKMQKHKHKQLQNEIGKKQTKLDITVKVGKSLEEKSTPEDLEVIQEKIEVLVAHWDSVCLLSVERYNDLKNTLIFHSTINDTHELLKWLTNAEPSTISKPSILGDTDTVKSLLDDHRIFARDLAKKGVEYECIVKKSESLLVENKIRDADRLRDLLDRLKTRWQFISQSSNSKKENLNHAFTLAKGFQDGCINCVNNLSELEERLKLHGPIEDVTGITKMMEELAQFQQRFVSEEMNVNACLKKSEVILQRCHPSAVHSVKHHIAVVKKRWAEFSSWAKPRKQHLDNGLQKLIDEEKEVKVLLEWISETEMVLDQRERVELPQDYELLVDLFNEHQSICSEFEKRQTDYDRITKKAKPRRCTHEVARDLKSMSEHSNPMVLKLSKRWKKIEEMVSKRRQKIEKKMEEIRIKTASAVFNWEEWLNRYNQWLDESKSRVLDMWRKKDVDKDNKLTRDQFVHGLLDTNFISEKWEIEMVFDTIKRGQLIAHDDFMDVLKGRVRKPDLPKTEFEEFQDIIAEKFTMSKIAEGTYRFGDMQKLCLVRKSDEGQFMIRVGGGWITLGEFIDNKMYSTIGNGANDSLIQIESRTSPGAPNANLEAFANNNQDKVGNKISSLAPIANLSKVNCKSKRESGLTIPKYKKATYVGKSSGYGVTHQKLHKEKESTAMSTPIKFSATTFIPGSKDDDTIFVRHYESPKAWQETSTISSPFTKIESTPQDEESSPTLIKGDVLKGYQLKSPTALTSQYDMVFNEKVSADNAGKTLEGINNLVENENNHNIDDSDDDIVFKPPMTPVVSTSLDRQEEENLSDAKAMEAPLTHPLTANEDENQLQRDNEIKACVLPVPIPEIKEDNAEDVNEEGVSHDDKDEDEDEVIFDTEVIQPETASVKTIDGNANVLGTHLETIYDDSRDETINEFEDEEKMQSYEDKDEEIYDLKTKNIAVVKHENKEMNNDHNESKAEELRNTSCEVEERDIDEIQDDNETNAKMKLQQEIKDEDTVKNEEDSVAEMICGNEEASQHTATEAVRENTVAVDDRVVNQIQKEMTQEEENEFKKLDGDEEDERYEEDPDVREETHLLKDHCIDDNTDKREKERKTEEEKTKSQKEAEEEKKEAGSDSKEEQKVEGEEGQREKASHDCRDRSDNEEQSNIRLQEKAIKEGNGEEEGGEEEIENENEDRMNEHGETNKDEDADENGHKDTEEKEHEEESHQNVCETNRIVVVKGILKQRNCDDDAEENIDDEMKPLKERRSVLFDPERDTVLEFEKYDHTYLDFVGKENDDDEDEDDNEENDDEQAQRNKEEESEDEDADEDEEKERMKEKRKEHNDEYEEDEDEDERRRKMHEERMSLNEDDDEDDERERRHEERRRHDEDDDEDDERERRHEERRRHDEDDDEDDERERRHDERRRHNEDDDEDDERERRHEERRKHNENDDEDDERERRQEERRRHNENDDEDDERERRHEERRRHNENDDEDDERERRHEERRRHNEDDDDEDDERKRRHDERRRHNEDDDEDDDDGERRHEERRRHNEDDDEDDERERRHEERRRHNEDEDEDTETRQEVRRRHKIDDELDKERRRRHEEWRKQNEEGEEDQD